MRDRFTDMRELDLKVESMTYNYISLMLKCVSNGALCVFGVEKMNVTFILIISLWAILSSITCVTLHNFR